MSVSTTVGLERLPAVVRSLHALDRVDYVDHYVATAPAAGERTPEQWARTVLEGTPLGRRARLLWTALGLRLAPPGSPDHVQGWAIRGRGDDWIRLETASWFMTGNAVLRVDAAAVSLALFLRYDNLVARVVWSGVGVVHRRAVPTLLHEAVERV